jgi:hypothetical protein
VLLDERIREGHGHTLDILACLRTPGPFRSHASHPSCRDEVEDLRKSLLKQMSTASLGIGNREAVA